MARTVMPSSVEDLQALVIDQRASLDAQQETIEAKQVMIDHEALSYESVA